MLLYLLACDAVAPVHAVRVSHGERTLLVDASGAAEFTDISGALKAATTGDTIEVAPGKYYGAIDFGGKAVRIVGTAGSAETWLYATPGLPAISSKSGEGKGTIFEGFTVTGGGGKLEPVIDQSFAGLTLKDVKLTGNAGRVILYARSAMVTLDHVDFAADNVAYEGMVIESRRGLVTIKDSTMACGTAKSGYMMEHGAVFIDGATIRCPGAIAASIYHSNGRVQRSVFDGVVAIENEESGAEPTTVEGSVFLGGVTVKLGGLTMHNSVVTGGGVSAIASKVDVDGTILFGNDCGVSDDRANVSVSECLFFDNTENGCNTGDPVGSSGNIEGDPLFVAADDFHLSTGSPAINMGPDSEKFRDLDGTQNDMGAYGGPFSLEGGW